MTLCCNVTYLLYCASEMSCVGYGSPFYDLAMWSKKFQNTQLIVDCSLSYTSTFTRQNVPRARKQESYSLYVWCTGAGRDSSVGIATRYGLDGPGIESSRSQWPSGLRRESATDRLLGLRVRIPLGAWMFVLCVLYNKDKR